MQEELDSDLNYENPDYDVVTDDEVDEPAQPEEQDEPEEEVETGESEEKPTKSSYVDTSKIQDPELRKQVEGRIGELYRQTMEGKKAQSEAQRLQSELDAIRNKQELVEVPAPSVDLAIDNPTEFAKQQKAHSEYLAKKYAHDQQEQAKAEQLKEATQKAQQEEYAAYMKRSSEMKISTKDLQVATEQVISSGLNNDVQRYLVKHKYGPAIVKHLGFDFEALHEVSSLPTTDAIEYIVSNVLPKAVTKKTPSAPPPPKKVTGARNSGQSVEGWEIS